MRPPAPHPLHRVVAVLLAVVLGASLAACSARPPGADAAAARFLDALTAGDDAAAAAATDTPDAAGAVLAATREGLAAQGVRTELGAVRAEGDTATAEFTAHWTLARDRQWSYPGQLQLARRGEAWSVRWSTADLHPRLGATQSLALRVDAPPRAAVLDAGGTEVLAPTDVVRVVLTPREGVDVRASATALVGVLATAVPGLEAGRITSAVADGQPHEVAVVRAADLGDAAAALAAVPGVSTGEESRLLPTDPTFAPALLTEVGSSVEADLAGQAGWRVVVLGPNGGEVDTLTEQAATPAASVSLSVDRGVQLAAQQAVGEPALPTAMVVLRPSTGEVLAVAQNGAADADGPIALQGLYPPGSTFKIITAAAALERGTSTAEGLVPCPSRTTIEDRTVPNINLFDLGTVPLKTAFARSCNTTFARLASELPADGLTAAARQLGVGVDYDVPGLTTVTGSVPPTDRVVLRAEDGFGQGEVLVSPFGMALAAASVAAGRTPPPVLLEGGGTTSAAAPAPLAPGPLGDLRTLMREVMGGVPGFDSEDGTLLAHGKTGEAQYGVDGSSSHAWFVGYRGDLAFATLIVGGGASSSAVGVTRSFVEALPAPA